MPTDKGRFVIMKPKDEEGEVVEKEQDMDRFITGRDGDHLMCPFQCDECHFLNIMSRRPVPDKAEDVRMLNAIRRANLDAFWSREPPTVTKNLQDARRAVRISQSLGIPERKVFGAVSPFPLKDTFGMMEAVIILERSTDKGRHAGSIQFQTMRKTRTMFANIYQASAKGQSEMVLVKDKNKFTLSKGITHCEFFERFMQGAHKRMGDIVKPDRALSLPVLHRIMEAIESEWYLARTDAEKEELALEASFYLITYCGGLRGEETPLCDLTGMRKWWKDGDVPGVSKHATIALLGRIKGETGEKYHLMPLCATTRSGLEPRLWIGRAMDAMEKRGITGRPLFRTSQGFPIRFSEMEPKFIEGLEVVQATRPDILSDQINVEDEFGIRRSFRRGSTTETGNRGVPPEVIDANNRWQKVEKAGTSQASFTMREHYTDVRILLDKLLIYSSAL